MNPVAMPHERMTNTDEYLTQFGPISVLDQEVLTLSVVDGAQTTVISENTKEWLGIHVGTMGLLLPITAGRELLNLPPIARLPHTPPWLLGMANVRGSLVPVVDTARALELAHNTATCRYLLIFNYGDEALGLIVDGLPYRKSFGADDCLNGLPPHPQLLDGHITAAYGKSGQLWFELDLDGFFNALAQTLAQT